ncbi:hypothetical protein ACS0TY_021992 [Phlomoides rotata]
MDPSNSIEQTFQENEIRVEENEVINDDGGDNTKNGGDGVIQIEEVNVDGEEGNNGEGGEGEEDKGNLEKKKRKKISKAHIDFVEVTANDGTSKFQCIHCKSLLSKPTSGTTSHLWNHLKRCVQKQMHNAKQKTLQFQPIKSKFEMNPLSDGRYDQMKQREAIGHWILMNEQPFNVVENVGFTFMLSINQPQFEKISRTTAKKDVINVYDIEKKKLQLTLKDINKISLTTDIWKSKVQMISYMCVTGHFVDSNWQLHKRLLSFIPLPPPHEGVDIFNGLM